MKDCKEDSDAESARSYASTRSSNSHKKKKKFDNKKVNKSTAKDVHERYVRREKKINNVTTTDTEDEDHYNMNNEEYEEENSQDDYSTYEDSDEGSGRNVNVIKINSFVVSQNPKRRNIIRPSRSPPDELNSNEEEEVKELD
jgi:hypothetical protein